jgi:hypothetical protein
VDGGRGEELLELAVELGRERLVVRDDERRPLHLGDDVGHGEGLARPGDPEEHLGAIPTPQRLGELDDRARLIAGRLELAPQVERHRTSLTADGALHSGVRTRARGASGPRTWTDPRHRP